MVQNMMRVLVRSDIIRKQCVPENWALKQKVIAQLDDLAPAHMIIASNSSSYGISEIIEGLDLKHKNRILSAHCCM